MGRGEQWGDSLPATPPGLVDRRVTSIPFGLEQLKMDLCHLNRQGLINGLQVDYLVLAQGLSLGWYHTGSGFMLIFYFWGRSPQRRLREI